MRQVLSFGFDIGRMSRDVAPAFRFRASSAALDGSPFAAIDHVCAHVLSETIAEPTRAREGSTFVRARRVGKDAPVVAPAGPPSPAAGRLPLRRRCLSSPRVPVPAGLLASSAFLGRGGGKEVVVSGGRDVGRRKFGDGDGALGLACCAWLRLVPYLPFFSFSIQTPRSGWDRSPGQIPVTDGTPVQLIGSLYGCPRVLGHDIGHRGAYSL